MVAGRKCSVPICPNKYKDMNNKIFIHVPSNKDIQKKWRNALKLPHGITFNRNNLVCEDHFDLEKDADNWMYYKYMGKRLNLKPGILPHKYMESPPPSNLPSSMSESDKERKLNLLEVSCHRTINPSKKVCGNKLSDEELSNQNIELKVHSSSDSNEVYHLYEGVMSPAGYQLNFLSEMKVQNLSIDVNAGNMVDPANSVSTERRIDSNITPSQWSSDISGETDTGPEIGWKQNEEKQNLPTEKMYEEGSRSLDLETMIDKYTIFQCQVKEETCSEQENNDQQNLSLKRKRCDVPISSNVEATRDTKQIAHNNNNIEDEYETFSKNIAGQLRQLPQVSFIILKQKIQELISNEIKYLPSDPNHSPSWIKTEKE